MLTSLRLHALQNKMLIDRVESSTFSFKNSLGNFSCLKTGPETKDDFTLYNTPAYKLSWSKNIDFNLISLSLASVSKNEPQLLCSSYFL